MVFYKQHILTLFILVTGIATANAQGDGKIIEARLSGKEKDLPVYGFNGNNTRGPGWSDKAFRDSAASLGLRIIRYPGGQVENWWDWQNGWFVKESDIKGLKFPNSFKGIKYSPTGLDELKQLTDEAGCDVIFELNMITRDVTDQIAMLKHAQSLGFKIKWVELANELNNEDNDGRQVYNTPTEYGNACRDWIKAIKKIFPDVKIAIIGGNRGYSEEAKKWNDIVLQCAPQADAIVVHVYPKAPTIIGDTGIDFHKLYDSFKKDYERQGFSEIKKTDIWATEYNILWSAIKKTPNGKELQKNAFTWGQALSTLLMTSFLSDVSDRVKVVVNHGIANTSIFAAIKSDDKSFRKLPNGLGMEAWLKASENMKTLNRLAFSGQPAPYELFGWKFSSSHQSRLLLVNLTAEPKQIDLTPLKFKGKNYKSEWAPKDKIIETSSDANRKGGGLTNNQITLPAYSFTTVADN